VPVLRQALRKIGMDVTETLELIPRQWKVIQHVRAKFSCRVCETITKPPAVCTENLIRVDGMAESPNTKTHKR
jgi:hypothetical protein